MSMSENQSFLATITKWRISGQGYKHLTRFQDPYCSNLQIVLCKRLTLSATSIFVTEALLIYIYFLLFEENPQNRISRARENISSTISLFFRKMIA